MGSRANHSEIQKLVVQMKDSLENKRTSIKCLVMDQGKLIIFSAPSGSGKSTIVRHLLRRDVPIEFSVSATNRAPRGREENGVDYYFLSSEEFKSKINSKAFLEWEEVYPGRDYGTLYAEVERIGANRKQVVVDIDVEGGLNLKKQFGEELVCIYKSTLFRCFKRKINGT